MDSQKRQVLRDRLLNADPALDHPNLEASRARVLKAEILDQVARPAMVRPPVWPRLAVGFTLIAALTFLLFRLPLRPKAIDDQVIQTAENGESGFRNLKETRLSELHFTTPGGTRIIWQFKSEASASNPSKITP